MYTYYQNTHTINKTPIHYKTQTKLRVLHETCQVFRDKGKNICVCIVDVAPFNFSRTEENKNVTQHTDQTAYFSLSHFSKDA